MDDLYREQILNHYREPRNKGRLDLPDLSYVDDNPLCGDRVQFDVRLDGDSRVADVAWDGNGCAISMASASMLSEMIKGKSVDELRELTKDDVLDMLGIELGPVRLKCALLALKVLKAGVYGVDAPPDEE